MPMLPSRNSNYPGPVASNLPLPRALAWRGHGCDCPGGVRIMPFLAAVLLGVLGGVFAPFHGGVSFGNDFRVLHLVGALRLAEEGCVCQVLAGCVRLVCGRARGLNKAFASDFVKCNTAATKNARSLEER